MIQSFIMMIRVHGIDLTDINTSIKDFSAPDSRLARLMLSKEEELPLVEANVWLPKFILNKRMKLKTVMGEDPAFASIFG